MTSSCIWPIVVICLLVSFWILYSRCWLIVINLTKWNVQMWNASSEPKNKLIPYARITKRHDVVYSIIELLPLPVPFSLSKYFFWEKYCNYPLITIKLAALQVVGFVKEKGGDQRKLFRATKALLMPKDEICFPNCHALANDIVRYFHRKILNIRNELDCVRYHPEQMWWPDWRPCFQLKSRTSNVFSRNWQRRMITSSFRLLLRKAVCSILCQLLSYWTALKNSFQ